MTTTRPKGPTAPPPPRPTIAPPRPPRKPREQKVADYRRNDGFLFPFLHVPPER